MGLHEAAILDGCPDYSQAQPHSTLTTAVPAGASGTPDSWATEVLDADAAWAILFRQANQDPGCVPPVIRSIQPAEGMMQGLPCSLAHAAAARLVSCGAS